MTFKIFYEKELISGILFFTGEKKSCLRSHRLLLWSLGTLSGQQRFYGTRLVTRKRRYYQPLSLLPEIVCIAAFVLNY
jgi:hypothetical protein